MPLKIFKARHYVTKAAHGTPVLLGRKVDDQVIVSLVGIRFAQLDLMTVASPDVIPIHIGIPFLEP